MDNQKLILALFRTKSILLVSQSIALGFGVLEAGFLFSGARSRFIAFLSIRRIEYSNQYLKNLLPIQLRYQES